MLKSTQEMLEFAYDVLNEVYFDNELLPIAITIMSSPRTNAHFTLGRVWRAEGERFHEINISAEHLDRPVENIIASLLHEMVHWYCHLNGLQDTSQGGRYHNKVFKKEAEKRGLIISYAKYIGYSVTEPAEELKEVIRSHNIEKPLDINRDGERMVFIGRGGDDNSSNGTGTNGVDAGAVQKPKCSTRKYVCPQCKNSFRATKDINVLCLDCMTQFVKVEK